MLIFLIGMMGSGKTTLGQQLATSLQVPFVDLDAYIEKYAQKSIPQIFEKDGADQFRLLEREALELVVQEYEQAVIATGGGTPCFFDNMAFINKHGKSIFLDVAEDEIFSRLKATDLATRPLLAGKSDEELKGFITTTLKQRKRFYNKANHILDAPHHTFTDLLTLLNHK